MDLYHAAFESFPDVLICLDRHGRIIRANRQAEAVLGYAREELIGKGIGKLLAEGSPAGSSGLPGRLLEAAGDGPAGGIPVAARRKDGSGMVMEAFICRVEMGRGPIVIAALRDNEAKLEAERNRKDLLHRLEISAEAAGMGYWTYDEATGRFWCDERFARLFGGSAGDFRDLDAVRERMPPEDRDRRWQAIRESLAAHGRYASEFRVVHPDGSLHWLGDVGRCIGFEKDRPRTFAGVAFDISERKAAEDRALAARQRERDLFEMAPDGIFVANRDGIYIDVNDSGCRLLGRAREEIVGRSLMDFVVPKECSALLDMRERMQSGGIQVAEWNLRHKQGCTVPVEISARIFPDGRWQEFARDISERKEAERVQARLIQDLRASLHEVKVLRGLLPICVHCKRIRDEAGEWEPVESYIRKRTEARFSHGICPACMERHYPEFAFITRP